MIKLNNIFTFSSITYLNTCRVFFIVLFNLQIAIGTSQNILVPEVCSNNFISNPAFNYSSTPQEPLQLIYTDYGWSPLYTPGNSKLVDNTAEFFAEHGGMGMDTDNQLQTTEGNYGAFWLCNTYRNDNAYRGGLINELREPILVNQENMSLRFSIDIACLQNCDYNKSSGQHDGIAGSGDNLMGIYGIMAEGEFTIPSAPTSQFSPSVEELYGEDKTVLLGTIPVSDSCSNAFQNYELSIQNDWIWQERKFSLYNAPITHIVITNSSDVLSARRFIAIDNVCLSAACGGRNVVAALGGSTKSYGTDLSEDVFTTPIQSGFDTKRYSDVHLSRESKSYAVTSKDGGYALGIYQDQLLTLKVTADYEIKASEITTDPEGYVYVTASSKSRNLYITRADDIELQTLTASCPSSYCQYYGYVLKFHPALNAVSWNLTIPSSFNISIEDMYLADDKLILTGTAIGDTYFDPINPQAKNIQVNGTKAFVAQYNLNNAIPQLDWNRSVYLWNTECGYAHGFGVCSDVDNNIYMCGSWINALQCDPSGDIKLETDNTGSTSASIAMAGHSSANSGFVVGFTSSGEYLGICEVTSNVAVQGIPLYLMDIEFYNGKLYGVGAQVISSFDISGAGPVLSQSEFYPNHYYEELAISRESCTGAQLYAAGHHNGTSDLAVLDAFDFALNRVHQRRPGGAKAMSKSVSVHFDKILMGGYHNATTFDPNREHEQWNFRNRYKVQKSGEYGVDFFTTLYECHCFVTGS